MNSKRNTNKKLFYDDLYRSYYDNVYTKVCSICFSQSIQDREDCATQTFVTAIEKYETLKEHPNKLGYLINIAKNITYNFNTKYSNNILRYCSLDENIPQNISVEEQIENILVQEEIDKRNLYRLIINSLSEKEQELYFLKFVKKMSYEDIANLLNMSNSTIRVKVSRLKTGIINKLKRFLK